MSKFEKNVFLSALTVVLLAVAVCIRFFGEIVLHPNEFLFGPDGDGLKNYFSVAYQVVHGNGLWFNGMLYPYGDHLIFADGQPLLTRILQFFIEPDVNNGPEIIAIINLLMIGSLVITAWCVHRLLVWNYVNPWFAIPFTLTITFLSPQVARFVGHYALAYTFFVPMSWLLISSLSRSKWPWLVAIITSGIVLAFGFLHPYYLFIFVIFLGAVLMWEIIVKRFRIARVSQLIPRLFTLLSPLILFMVYQKMVDPYIDRPTSPGGLFHYNSSVQSIFTPVCDPFRELFHSYFFRVFEPTNWEGNAYVGLISTLTILIAIFTLVRQLSRRGLKILTHPVLPQPLRESFIPAIFTLLFAMGVFHVLGLEWLADFIRPLKQFRSVGRVAWIFYYVCSIWTVYRLYVLFRHFRSLLHGRLKFHLIVIMVLCVFVWTLDSIVNIKYHKAKMLNRNASESFSDVYNSEWTSAGVQLSEYQAILPLPLQLIGSEKINLNRGNESLSHAMKGAFSTGLPVIGGAMSRTSYELTQKTAQLVADSLFSRPLLDDFKDDLKLLIVRSNEPLTKAENHLIGLAEKVFESEDGYRLYSLSVENIKRADESSIPEIPDSLISIKPSYFQPVDHEKTKDSLWGAPIYSMKSGDVVFDTVYDSEDTLHISYWIKIEDTDGLPPCRIFSVDRTWELAGGLGHSPNIMDGWLFISEDLLMKTGVRHRYSIDARPGLISRFQLRKKDEIIVHSEASGRTFYNNIPVL